MDLELLKQLLTIIPIISSLLFGFLKFISRALKREIKKGIEPLEVMIRINEKDRLKDKILAFKEKLKLAERNPELYIIDARCFEVIYEDYAKYKSLGGNHFVDLAKDYIDERYQYYLHNGVEGE